MYHQAGIDSGGKYDMKFQVNIGSVSLLERARGSDGAQVFRVEVID